MLKKRTTVSLILVFIVLLVSCTSTKNTSGTRWYHSFNTRYNVYFNGEQAFNEAMKTQQQSYKENYSDMILMYPVSSLPKDKEVPGGPFDRPIEKSVKAIKTHSIQTKPEKEAGKRNDPKYQEFMSRTEYNPFLHNAWMLMAKSQFYNGDFLVAASTFSYISRLYKSQPEIVAPAKIWQARCYSEMGWYYEAEDLLTKVNNEYLPKKESDWFSSVYADFLVKQKQYQEAIPYLKTAIKAEKNKFQRSRMKYLLGQLYADLGQREMAYQTFGDVVGPSTPYILEFNAKIRQTEVYPGGDTTKVVRQLRKMAKSVKNKEYLDQVYYALGNVYMFVPDTAKAVESYELGVEKSTSKGLEKAFCQIKLGDIYFQQRNYVNAQPNYSEALGLLKKEDKDYARVSKRSEVLDELVVHVEAVQLQDSVQRLSRMPESERMAVIDKIIKDLIKKEEEEKKKQEREEFLAGQDIKRSELNTMGPPPGVINTAAPRSESNAFYFYNPQAVALGKSAFQQKWGRRKLEDNWRRRNKTNPLSDSLEDTETADTPSQEVPADSVQIDKEDWSESGGKADAEISSDPKDPKYYLQQIPMTQEDLAASDLIIADGLFNMGVIYKDKLEDASLALETFHTLDSRFPENEHKLDAYYHTYMIYLKEGNKEMAELYKSKIRAGFPESDYAIAMADPDYEYNLKMMVMLQDSIYQQTYHSYLEGDVPAVRKNYDLAVKKYTQSKLMPKFMFLNALSYVQTSQADSFKVRLKELIEKYPDADVSVLAGEMMKGFQRGLLLSASGDNMLARGSLFNIRFGGSETDSLSVDSIGFSTEKNTAHELLLVYPQGTINDNMLLYTVASFNFSNFLVNDFDLEKTTAGSVGILQIKGFNNYDEIIQYVRMINQPEGYARGLGQNVVVVPISVDNFNILMKGKSLDEYLSFFEEHFGAENRSMIEKWKLKQAEELETLPEDSLQTDDLLPEVTKEVEEEMQEEEKTEPLVPVTIDKDTINVSVPEVLKTDSIRPVRTDSEININQNDILPDKVLEKTEETIDKASDALDNVNKTIDEINADPIRGIKGLFKKKSSNPIDEYAKEQEKAEKERQKQLKKEQEEQEKAEKELEKQKEKEKQALLKKQEEEEKQLLKEKKQREEELEKLKKAELRQKEEEKERLRKEKEDARKAKQKAYEAEQKKKAEERKEKEKAYKEEQKLKEKAREEARKQKEAERKAKEKQREEERKAKKK